MLIQSDLGRFIVFIIITVAEILLTIFLLFYGSENLKFFAVLLLFVQLFAVYKIYLYLLLYVNRIFRYYNLFAQLLRRIKVSLATMAL